MKENLEMLKMELEEMKTYLGSDLYVLYNRNTEAFEILISKRKEKSYQKSNNIVYQNLYGVSVKIIHKNRHGFIKPSCYCFKESPIVFEDNKSYTKEDLYELEKEINQNHISRR